MLNLYKIFLLILKSQFMSDSQSCAIDFDAVKREYCNAHVGSEDNAKSVDALV